MGNSSFVFRPGLLRGFKGEILQSACDVEKIDLEALAEECRSWAEKVLFASVNLGMIQECMHAIMQALGFYLQANAQTCMFAGFVIGW